MSVIVGREYFLPVGKEIRTVRVEKRRPMTGYDLFDVVTTDYPEADFMRQTVRAVQEEELLHDREAVIAYCETQAALWDQRADDYRKELRELNEEDAEAGERWARNHAEDLEADSKMREGRAA